jgi:pyruvate/2-oxoacid:ferredoxin oxidoreductase beta subunit
VKGAITHNHKIPLSPGVKWDHKNHQNMRPIATGVKGDSTHQNIKPAATGVKGDGISQK